MRDKTLVKSSWTLKNCDICGQDKALHSLGRREFELPAENSLYEFIHEDVICERCGFIFSGKVPENDFLSRYYENTLAIQSEQVEIPPDYDMEARLNNIQSVVSKGSTVLEVGANTGEFCERLNKIGFRASGLDPLADEECTDAVSNAFLGENPASSDTTKFDVVCSYFVLEHVVDAGKWLSEVLESLKQGGTLILEVPNFEEYPIKSLHGEHFLHFRTFHLEQLLKSFGLEIVSIGDEYKSRPFGVNVTARLAKEQRTTGDVLNSFSKEQIPENYVNRGIKIYKEANKELSREESRYQALADKLSGYLLDDQTQTEILFWGASEAATDIKKKLDRSVESQSEKIREEISLIDSSDTKIGTMHPAFSSPIRSPNLEDDESNQYIFVVCSKWYDQISRQIAEMDLTNVLVIDAMNWEPDESLE